MLNKARRRRKLTQAATRVVRQASHFLEAPVIERAPGGCRLAPGGREALASDRASDARLVAVHEVGPMLYLEMAERGLVAFVGFQAPAGTDAHPVSVLATRADR